MARLNGWPVLLLISSLLCHTTCGQFLTAGKANDGRRQPIVNSAASLLKRQSGMPLPQDNYQPSRNQLGEYTTTTTNNNNNNNNNNSNNNNSNNTQASVRKCTRQSIILARQMLAHELNYINQFNSMWFSDLDRAELIEGQKHSLSKIAMSGASASLLNSNGQPLIDIESSYFRQRNNQNNHQQWTTTSSGGPIALRLLRRHQDKCQLNWERNQFSYTASLSVGPIEHHLDVVYNLPRELQLSQPVDWRYGQITISVPKMLYEIEFRQTADYKLANSLGGLHGGDHRRRRRGTPFGSCPLEVSDLTYLATAQYQQQQQQQQQQQATRNNQQHPTGQSISITSSGLALNNQTRLQIERLFDDYTRPAVSQRLRQMLKFYLNSKTLPLSESNLR